MLTLYTRHRALSALAVVDDMILSWRSSLWLDMMIDSMRFDSVGRSAYVM
jgi:hypothetical protein